MQLVQGRQRIEHALGRPVRRLAWPFGMTDAGLMALAGQTGHDAAFSLGDQAATLGDDAFALPRWLVTEATRPQALAQRLRAAFGHAAG